MFQADVRTPHPEGMGQADVPDDTPDSMPGNPSGVAVDAVCVAWPPRHDVRVSPRARRVRLRIVPSRGLEVVVPRGFATTRIPEVLERHRTWIVRALDRAGLLHGGGRGAAGTGRAITDVADVPGVGGEPGGPGAPGGPDGPAGGAGMFAVPAEVVFPAVQAHYALVRSPLAAGMRAEAKEAGVTLRMRVPDGEAGNGMALDLLRQWVREVARRRFGPWLHALAVEHGFSYRRCVVRTQRTRWGSCSAKGVISCNANLLFLPRELARHVLLHELCHTVHLDHSPRFHALLASVDPEGSRWREALRSGWSHVPMWAR